HASSRNLLRAHCLYYSLPIPTKPHCFNATLLYLESTSVFGDFRDRNTLANAFTDFQPEIVIHCAWHSGQQRASREPVETFATNLMGAVHVLDESRLTASVRGLVLATNWEDDTPTGDDPHAAAIASAEIASSA